ncbi:MAG: ABC transporter ATP-binding protein [Alphaproteobacteria bacterium]
MSESIVSCTNLKKTYGAENEPTKVQALRGITLEAYKGELLMLVGPSGCGKTTLISIIAGILNYNEGNCAVLGNVMGNLTDAEKNSFRAKNIGFVFQAFNLIPSLTSAENVAVPLIINGISRHEAVHQAKELLKDVGLEDKVDTLPNDLSGGQQQRVAIARALIHDPQLIVCDEPTSSLDGETGQKILDLMKKIVLQKGRTLIVVTHDIRIFPFADRIAMMEDGIVKKVVNSYKDALKSEEEELLTGKNR